MDVQLLTGILMGCAASITMNMGKGIQKMKVQVLRTGRKVLAPENRRDFTIWLIGMLMTGGAGLLFTAALKMTDKPSVVSSLNGVGLIALAIFSAIVLKEKVGGRELSAVGMIIVGTALFQYFNRPTGEEQEYSLPILLLCIGICVAFYTVAVIASLKAKKGQAFVFAAIGGSFLAFMVIFMDIAGVKGEGKPFIQTLLTVYFLIGFFMGNGAFVFTNLAFFHGSGIVIVPTVNSFMIVVPMALEFFIFGVSIAAVQVIGVAMIVGGVILLTTGKGHGVEQAAQAA